jgi:dTDP-glucose pyrophosphorylase
MSQTLTHPIGDYVLGAGATLREGMMTLERCGCEIVLMTDDAGLLLGIATDGDIRRALLRGAALDDGLADHVKRNFVYVSPSVGRAEVLDIMSARRITQVPVLDGNRRLVGLHLLHDIVGSPERPNWAVVMAGGRGTRLAPLTQDVPKPMIRVAGRPILERIVLHIVSYGIREIFLAVNYLGEQVVEHFGDGGQLGCRIRYLLEDRPLGTGGALALLPEAPPGPLLVMNGDLVTQANLGGMLDAHARGGAAVTIGVRRYLHTVPFGCVTADRDRVTGFEEKPTLSRIVNAGIYVLDPALLSSVERNVEFPITSLFEGCLRRGEQVRTFEIEEDWMDVGQREQLQKARGIDPT